MLLSALSFLVVAQSSLEVPEGLMNNPVHEMQRNVVQMLVKISKFFFFSTELPINHENSCGCIRNYMQPHLKTTASSYPPACLDPISLTRLIFHSYQSSQFQALYAIPSSLPSLSLHSA